MVAGIRMYSSLYVRAATSLWLHRPPSHAPGHSPSPVSSDAKELSSPICALVAPNASA